MSAETQRGPKGRRRYRMDYIADKDLFKAVCFSRKMISEGVAPGIAHKRAASYYGVDPHDVAKYTGQYAGSMSHKRRKGGAS